MWLSSADFARTRGPRPSGGWRRRVPCLSVGALAAVGDLRGSGVRGRRTYGIGLAFIRFADSARDRLQRRCGLHELHTRPRRRLGLDLRYVGRRSSGSSAVRMVGTAFHGDARRLGSGLSVLRWTRSPRLIRPAPSGRLSYAHPMRRRCARRRSRPAHAFESLGRSFPTARPGASRSGSGQDSRACSSCASSLR